MLRFTFICLVIVLEFIIGYYMRFFDPLILISCFGSRNFSQQKIPKIPQYFPTRTLFIVLSLQEEFPANTNILYVDLPSAELVGSSNNETSLPGMVLNIKKPIKYVDHLGIQHWYIPRSFTCWVTDYFI